MDQTFNPDTVRRFLRTLRVATGTALAEHDLAHRRGFAGATATFHALAAKGTGEWRFPDGGVMSSDGLVRARLVRDDIGKPLVIEFQAQGSAGLLSFAERSIEADFGAGRLLGGRFDRDGRLMLRFEDTVLGEGDLATFELRFTDGLP